MTVHIKKLSVGSSDVASLYRWQQRFKKYPYHTTRHRPKSYQDIINSGSLYWIISGVMLARQKIIDFEETISIEDDRPITRWNIILERNMWLVTPTAHRPFQGWRYLQPNDAPSDITLYNGDNDNYNLDDAKMIATLRDIGVM